MLYLIYDGCTPVKTKRQECFRGKTARLKRIVHNGTNVVPVFHRGRRTEGQKNDPLKQTRAFPIFTCSRSGALARDNAGKFEKFVVYFSVMLSLLCTGGARVGGKSSAFY